MPLGTFPRGLNVPPPAKDSTPVDYAEALGETYLSFSKHNHRKSVGHYLTPATIAKFMANCSSYSEPHMRVLDPGSGTGILSAAVCEAASQGGTVNRLHVDAYETDPVLAGLTRLVLTFSHRWLGQRGVALTFDVRHGDFVLESAATLEAVSKANGHEGNDGSRTEYGLVISNPPYFKIGKDDPRAVAWASVVHGQPNIYALFMAISAATSGMQRIEEMSDADVAEVRESAELFRGVEDTTADLRGLLDFLCGLRWLTSDMRGKAHTALETPLVETLGSRPNDAYSLLARGPDAVGDEETGGDGTSWSGFKELWSDARCIADREGFLHWEAAFPGVWQRWQEEQPVGGFDAVIGNPPWDRIKLQEVEWFATRSPELALAPTAAARKTGIQQLRDKGAPLAGAFDAAKERSDKLGELIRASGNYPLLGGGDINLYSLFVERAMGLIKLDGFVGLLTPSGIYADKTAAAFFKSISTSGRVGGLFDFENRRLGTGLPPFFPDVDSRFKFCALIFGGTERRFDETECAFFLHDTRTIENPERCFPLAPSDFARVNPNIGTAPIFRTRRDAEITRRIYERHPVLVDRSLGEERRAWPVRYHTMFHMANDSHLFRTAAQLESEGFYPVEGNRWQKGKELYLPLYEGKMVQAFDHRAASITNREGNLFRPGQPDRTLDDEHRDPAFSPRSRYWVSRKASTFTETHGWSLAFKDITASTNVRTMIAAVVPQVGCGHTLPVLIPAGAEFDAGSTAQVLANLNSFGFDYVTRQKVQATHLTWYIVEQLPVIAAEGYDRRFGDKTARELVRDHALRLTYTANDMAPFARDLGFDGPPFIWDEEERRHLRARLDALYFHLYGLPREDAGYVLDTFPIVRRQDDAQFGSYRTRDLIFAYMNALAAGDAETVVSV